MTAKSNAELMEMTSEIVASYVSHNPVQSGSLPDLIKSVHETIISLSSAPPAAEPAPEPAISIAKSITPEFLICLEDGRKLKMLKRYLRSRYDMSPEDYRARWNLPSDYPMVAPEYAKRRSAFAKEIGLGKKKK